MAGRFEIHQLSLGAYGKAFVPKGKIEFSGNTVSRAFFQKVYYGTFKQWENKNSGSSRTRKTYDISQISLVLELPAAQAHGDFFVSQYALEKNSYPFQLLSRPPNSMNYYSDSEALLKPLNTL